MDKDFTISTDALYANERTNPKAIRNRMETMKLIDKHGGLSGNVLDIGERNLFTEILESRYNIPIYNTYGDLDTGMRVRDEAYGTRLYDWVHYNNVIEHQFSPLFTLLKIKYRMNPWGKLILGCPIKPTWITFSRCHFHEFDQYRFDKLIARAGFTVVDKIHFWHELNGIGVRNLLGSLYTKQAVYILTIK